MVYQTVYHLETFYYLLEKDFLVCSTARAATLSAILPLPTSFLGSPATFLRPVAV